jgi:hypothetical protein
MRFGRHLPLAALLGLLLFHSSARADALMMNVQFGSGLSGTVSLGNGVGMLLTPGTSGSYQLTPAAYQDLTFEPGPMQIWPSAVSWAGSAFDTSDVYSQLAQMLLSTLPVKSFESGQFLLGSLSSSVLGETPAPLAGLVFVRPGNSPNNTPFNYVAGFQFPANAAQNMPNPVGEAPESGTVALLAGGLALLGLRKKLRK